MGEAAIHFFVIKVQDLPALNYLAAGYPRPVALAWINRGTDQALRPSTVEQLLRTMFNPDLSDNLRRLQANAGLRAEFETEGRRNGFHKAFRAALDDYVSACSHIVAGIFPDRSSAEAAIIGLKANRVPERAISQMWRTGQFIQPGSIIPKGHSKTSIASAASGGGIVGALLGVGLLLAPGIGGLAAAGGIAAQALGSIGAFGSALGATGGAIARMLTDIDVDGREAEFYAASVLKGSVVVGVDLHRSGLERHFVQELLHRHGARWPFGAGMEN
ncbi:hypothetical protein RXV95_11945 [Novosphingobium sp. ZN18A2]|uniref:hypothetical protein n=1 Tax=Novosphingobium sp. ZN18A2 TaxID=3079861 RepID=UPI0030D2B613